MDKNVNGSSDTLSSYLGCRFVRENDRSFVQLAEAGKVRSKWNGLWESCDFSWQGLADAGWDLGERATEAQVMKRWKAPPNLKGAGRIVGEGNFAYRQSNLQEYWRWCSSLFDDQLVDDDILIACGLIVPLNGDWYHISHFPHGLASNFLDNKPDIMRSGISLKLAEKLGCDQNISTRDFLLRFVEYLQANSSTWLVDGPRSSVDRRLQLVGCRQKLLFQNISNNSRKLENNVYIRASLSDLSSVDFRETLFGDFSDFRLSWFSDASSFSQSTFGSDVDFSGAYFGKSTDFSRCVFADRTGFDNVVLGAESNFTSTKFGSETVFWDAVLERDVLFLMSEFGEKASFDRVFIGSGCDFGFAKFQGASEFRAECFDDEVDFTLCEFHGTTDFSGTTFLGTLCWENALFKSVADFSDVYWHNGTHYSGAFSGARFEDVAYFQTPNFSSFAAFHDAIFKNRLMLKPPVEGMAPEDMYRQAERACQLHIQHELEEKVATQQVEGPKDIKVWRNRVSDEAWSELSGGYRTAKKTMEAAGDFEREQSFYRFEIKAKMRRPFISFGEKFAALLYNFLSDYGMSIWRPLLGLFVSITVFSSIFLVLAVLFTEAKIAPPLSNESPYLNLQPSESLLQSVEFSIGNVFRPLSALSTSPPTDGVGEKNCSACNFPEQLLRHEDGWIRLTIKSLAIFQSVLSIVLAFLFGLAIRRKFQIS